MSAPATHSTDLKWSHLPTAGAVICAGAASAAVLIGVVLSPVVHSGSDRATTMASSIQFCVGACLLYLLAFLIYFLGPLGWRDPHLPKAATRWFVLCAVPVFLFFPWGTLTGASVLFSTAILARRKRRY